MKKYKAIDIARWFINRSKEETDNKKMNLLKLMKLIYYAEGCSLALNDKSLFDEKILAWEHGPAIQEVWDVFAAPSDLTVNEKDMTKSINKITNDDKQILEDVYSIFGKYTALQLKNKTRFENPWADTTNNGTKFKKEIPRNKIKKYFKENYITD